jgi:hypothetical protein
MHALWKEMCGEHVGIVARVRFVSVSILVAEASVLAKGLVTAPAADVEMTMTSFPD